MKSKLQHSFGPDGVVHGPSGSGGTLPAPAAHLAPFLDVEPVV